MFTVLKGKKKSIEISGIVFKVSLVRRTEHINIDSYLFLTTRNQLLQWLHGKHNNTNTRNI